MGGAFAVLAIFGVLLRGGGFLHGAEQGAGAGFAEEGEGAGHVGLAVLGFAGEGVHQDVGIGEAGLVPRHPLHEVVLGIGGGGAIGGFGHADDFLAEDEVPIKDAVGHGLDVFGRGVGGVIEEEGLLEVKAVHAGGDAAGAEFELAFGLKETGVAVGDGIGFLAGEVAGGVGGDEVAGFVAGLVVLIKFAAAGLHALADDEVAILGAHFKHAALGHVENGVVLAQIEGAAIGPGLGEDLAHAFVEVHDHLVRVLPHNGEAGEQAAGGEIGGYDEAFGGFVHVHAVGEKFKGHNLAGEPVAGGGFALRNHGGAEEIILAKGGLGNGEQELVGHLQGRGDDGIVRAGAEGAGGE